MSMYQPKGAVEEKDSSETKDEGGEASPGDSKDKEDEPEEEVELSQAEKDAKILEGLPEDAQTILQVGVVTVLCGVGDHHSPFNFLMSHDLLHNHCYLFILL